MSTTLTRSAGTPLRPGPEHVTSSRNAPKRRHGWVLGTVVIAVMVWLIAPIAMLIAYGFNDTTSRLNFAWQGFTLRWYTELFAFPGLTSAVANSLLVAFIVTVVSVILGTLLGVGLGEARFRGKTSIDFLLFANIATPSITVGTGLLSLFLAANLPRGMLTVIIAHITFCIPFVAVTVQARMAGYDKSLSEASRDLGATSTQTLRLILLPYLRPAIIAGSLLAFAVSLDDYVVTQFTAGTTITFPLWVYSSTRFGTPPQVNVVGTLIFAVGLALAINSALSSRRAYKARMKVHVD